MDAPSGRPVRKSLTDRELFDLAASQDPAGALEQLQSQLALREQDAREYSAWESSMLAVGTPDALAEVSAARQEFDGLVPAAQDAAASDTIAPAEAPVEDEATPVENAPEEFAPAAPVDAPLPSWEVPPPSDTWAPAPDPDELPEPGQPEPEQSEPELVAEPSVSEPVVDLAEPELAPEFASEVASEEPVFAPVVDTEAVPEPVAEFEAVAVLDDESATVTEPAPTFEPEPFAEDIAVEEPVFEAEPVSEAEPVFEAEPVGEVEPVAEVEPVVEVEPVFEAEPVVEAEPVFEPSFEQETSFEPEPATALSFDDLLSGGVAGESTPDADVVPENVEPLAAFTTPEFAAPEFSEPEVVAEPEFTEPEFTDPEFTEPESSEPESVEPVADVTPPELVDPSLPFEESAAVDEPTLPEQPPVAEAPLVDSVPEFVTPSEVAEPQAQSELEPEPEPQLEPEPDPQPEPEPVIPELVEPLLAPPAPASDIAASFPAGLLTGESISAEILDAESADEEVIDAEIVEDEPPAPSTSTGFVFGAAAAGGVAAATPPAPGAFSFDDLLSGASDGAEEPPLHADAEPPSSAAFPEPMFIEPMPVAAGESVPTETGSVAIIDAAYEEELEDDVDETDRIPLVAGAAAAGAMLPPPISPPSGPIATVRIPEDEVVIMESEPVAPKAFVVEKAAVEPTPLDQRVGRAARLFWLWFAANSSVLSLALGATVVTVGLSLRQSIVAILAGVALSFIPLGLTTLAGKRSGQPTMVISRATFGHLGNIVPAIVALVTRVFWGAALLWLVASSISAVLARSDSAGGLPEPTLLLICLGGVFVIALVVAIFGYGLLARVQLVLSVLAGVLVVGFIALTASRIDLSVALTIPDGSWFGVITGAVLVFSLIGLVWANSGADLARYQRPGSSGGASMLWGTFGATVPAFFLIAYGALLAASNPGVASGFVQSPIDTLAMLLPSWYPIPLIAATGLSLLSGVIITIYSGAFAFQSIGVRVTRPVAVVIVGALLAIAAVVIAVALPGGLATVFRDAATTLAVPTAAWAGIFAAEMMIRTRSFDSDSLVKRGGVYADWRPVNLVGFIVITVLGFGLTTATVGWLGWQGYLLRLLGVPMDGPLAATDFGVLVALLLGLLLPLVAGIPAIRRQEEIRIPPGSSQPPRP